MSNRSVKLLESRELAALYKREGTSPFAGLLPLLAQWPLLSVLYLLFRSATVDGAQNRLLSDGLFGVPLNRLQSSETPS